MGHELPLIALAEDDDGTAVLIERMLLARMLATPYIVFAMDRTHSISSVARGSTVVGTRSSGSCCSSTSKCPASMGWKRCGSSSQTNERPWFQSSC